MQASFCIIVHNGISMSLFIRGSSARWSLVHMVRVTALDIQVTLRNPTAMLEDSMLYTTLFDTKPLISFTQHMNH